MSERRRLVVEADGGSRGNPGVAGYGALVRDADGALLATRAAPLGKASNNVAEYRGMIAGLEAARQIDPAAQVEVRMDSRLVVEQMSGRWKIKHPDMRELALQARDLARRLEAAGGSVRWTWIPRAQNAQADALSNRGMDGDTVAEDLWRAGAGSARTGPGASPDEGGPAAESPAAGSRAAGSRDARSRDAGGADAPDPGEGSAPAAGPVTTQVEQEQVLSTDRTPGSPPDTGRPVRVLLLRHGVTAFTEQGRLDGRGGPDPLLSPAGEAQARQSARRVAELVDGVEHVRLVTSSLQRARQTGAAVADLLGLRAEVDRDWDEQSFGEWDGLAVRDILRTDAAGLERLRGDDDFAPAGGESHADLARRVGAALDRAVAATPAGGTVVVATHRKPIMVVLARVLGLSTLSAWRVAAAPASLTGVELWADGHASVAFTNDVRG